MPSAMTREILVTARKAAERPAAMTYTRFAKFQIASAAKEHGLYQQTSGC